MKARFHQQARHTVLSTQANVPAHSLLIQMLPDLICLLATCGEKNNMDKIDKYIVETVVHLQQGKTNKVLELFKSTNPKLVSGESDWIRASFSTIEEKDIIIVRAEWKNKDSYWKFSKSEKFKETMLKFSKYFVEKPKVTITKVLFEM